MVSMTEIEAVARNIGEAAHAEQVILFGSYANGMATEESDVDLLVVAESDLPRHKRSRELYRMVNPHRFSMDILVYTTQEVHNSSDTPVSFVSQVLREGKPVYVRSA